MIRVYRKEGADSPLLDKIITADPVEAEAHYLELCKIRTDGPGVVMVVPQQGSDIVVPRGAYRTDADWRVDERGQPYREQERARAMQIWAYPPDGWEGPTPAQIRAALKVAGLSQTRFAYLVGISPRTVRYWCAGEKGPDWPTWLLLLSMAGHAEPFPAQMDRL